MSFFFERVDVLRTYLQDCTQAQIETQCKWLRFGEKEQQNERALTFIKNRSKRYVACSDVEGANSFEDISQSCPEAKSQPSASGCGLERRSSKMSAL